MGVSFLSVLVKLDICQKVSPHKTKIHASGLGKYFTFQFDSVLNKSKHEIAVCDIYIAALIVSFGYPNKRLALFISSFALLSIKYVLIERVEHSESFGIPLVIKITQTNT